MQINADKGRAFYSLIISAFANLVFNYLVLGV